MRKKAEEDGTTKRTEEIRWSSMVWMAGGGSYTWNKKRKKKLFS